MKGTKIKNGPSNQRQSQKLALQATVSLFHLSKDTSPVFKFLIEIMHKNDSDYEQNRVQKPKSSRSIPQTTRTTSTERKETLQIDKHASHFSSPASALEENKALKKVWQQESPQHTKCKYDDEASCPLVAHRGPPEPAGVASAATSSAQ